MEIIIPNRRLHGTYVNSALVYSAQRLGVGKGSDWTGGALPEENKLQLTTGFLVISV